MASLLAVDRDIRQAPIHDFVNDHEDGRMSRLLASNSQLPTYSGGVTAIHQSPSSGNGGGTSMLLSGHSSHHSGHSSLPALTRTGTSGTYSSTRSVSSSIGHRVLSMRILDQLPQEPLSVPVPHGPTVYECPFYYLHCLLTFSNFEDWYAHSLTHFEDCGPPSKANCCFCDNEFKGRTGYECWQYRMEHVELHHRWGHRLSHARPDFSMFRYLWEQNLLELVEYKELKGNSGIRPQESPSTIRDMGSSPPPLRPMSSGGPEGQDESRVAYTVSHDEGRQARDRRRQARLAGLERGRQAVLTSGRRNRRE